MQKRGMSISIKLKIFNKIFDKIQSEIYTKPHTLAINLKEIWHIRKHTNVQNVAPTKHWNCTAMPFIVIFY